MADNLNHNSVDITMELINIRKHIEAEKDASYFKISKFLNDYSTLYEEKLLLKDAAELGDEQAELNIKGRFNNKKYYEH
jgi:hypothetical protein